MEREKGLEPSTFAMATRRSSQLSYSRLGERNKELGVGNAIQENCQD